MSQVLSVPGLKRKKALEIVEMVSFELGEELNLRPSDLCSDALLLSHRDSSVSEVYYEVHMTWVLHTAGISNVDSIMFFR